MAEFVKRMKNNVILSGELVSIENPREGVTQAGVPYVSCRGTIACSEDGSQSFNFRVFSKEITSSGAESKAYPKLKAGILGGWVTREMAASNTGLVPTKLELHGGMNQNMYVTQEGKLVSGEEYGITFASDFKEYKAQVDLEAYISNVQEEVRDDQETGRYIYTLLSRDVFGNIIMPKVYADGEIYRALENAGITDGESTMFYLDITKRAVEGRSTGAVIGRGHDTGSFLRKEIVLTGCLPPYTDDKAIETSAAKTMIKEFEAKKREVEAEGYKGSSGRGGAEMIGRVSTPAPKVSIPQPTDNSVPSMDDLDDLPF